MGSIAASSETPQTRKVIDESDPDGHISSAMSPRRSPDCWEIYIQAAKSSHLGSYTNYREPELRSTFTSEGKHFCYRCTTCYFDNTAASYESQPKSSVSFCCSGWAHKLCQHGAVVHNSCSSSCICRHGSYCEHMECMEWRSETSILVDVEKGMEIKVFKEDQIVQVVRFSPNNYDLFISGGSKGHLKLWDIRTGTVVHEYVRSLGPILDVEFSVDGMQLMTSSDVSKSNISENSIIVWDVSRQVPLSNQVYAEAYTCPSIRCHPFEPYFIAQSHGNYIAIFSSRAPFKLDKYKRYEGHGVSGFPIKCNFSLDGNLVASGSSDGCIYFYNSKTSKLLSKVKAYKQACIDVVFHPALPNVVASCSWKGEISVLHKDRNNNWKVSP
ncbi:WD repeat-containing protein 25 isoform X4 [Salvia hispanica]|uniref:WD repeat-containing protein 25 isoform X4 n=1 Tax=Salvia hispanica TaxID=49212 RepID=UPI0020091BE3|nr:WD repeat-containing protein 25 isoform X4 [Salvia hispanica]